MLKKVLLILVLIFCKSNSGYAKKATPTISKINPFLLVKKNKDSLNASFAWKNSPKLEFCNQNKIAKNSAFYPVVNSRLTDQYPIQMPNTLRPYLLYANATIDPSLTITDIKFYVNNILQTSTTSSGNYYRSWWTPSQYGSHTVDIVATASNGNSTTKTVVVNVVNNNISSTVQTFQNNLINFDGNGNSQWYYGTYNLPQSLGAFSTIVANFSVTCPSISGGCDDWDRLAWVQIKNPEGQWVELFRYITPYGVACSHSIDVTDYESLLQGTVEFRMFIETWGTGGWNINLNLKYNSGMPSYLYSAVEEVWQGNYNFGDPANLQPVPIKTITAPANTQDMRFRLVTTGHGWGSNNTSNAAEFYNATHNLQVNGANTFTQALWTLCNPNPDSCTGQAGTWQYGRAGWCPGIIAKPYFYNLTPYINNPFTFRYQFKTSYQDLCHPNNPTCVSGTTCPDCNDGYNPYYRVGGYMIYKSNQPVQYLDVNNFNKSEVNNNIIIYPNSNDGKFKINMENDLFDFVINIFSINGQSIKTYFFKDKEELNNYSFVLNGISSGTYFVKIYNQNQVYSTKLVIK